MYNNKIIIILVGIILTASSITTTINQSAFSELYRNYDGRYITENIYEQDVSICSKFQQIGKIDGNVDCLDWVLSPEGNQWLAKYWHFKLYGN